MSKDNLCPMGQERQRQWEAILTLGKHPNPVSIDLREKIKFLALSYGHNYYYILDRLEETGDFTEANKADDTFAAQILNLFNQRLEEVGAFYPRWSNKLQRYVDEPLRLESYQPEDF